MPEQTNPFKRIHDILGVVIDHARERGYSTDELARVVWIAAFDLNRVSFLKNLYETMLIVDSCEQLVSREQTINRELYLSQLHKITTGLSLLSDDEGYWGTFQATINDDFMTSLLLMSDNVLMRGGEEVIPEEELASLQTDVEGIINRVVDSDLEDDIRRVLFDGLESVRNALLNYQMFGAEGIRQSLDRNFALPFRYSDEFIRASGSDEGKNIVAAFFEFLKRLNIVASTGLKIKQISGPAIDRMLESGG